MFEGLATFFSMIGDVYAATWFIVLPIMLYYLFKSLWMRYIGDVYWGMQEYMMLELVPPREIEKSPKVMESVYLGIAGVISTPSAVEEYVMGKFIPFVSMELVSTEGMVHFYIWLPRSMRPLVESHLFAQYPNMEIHETNDYTETTVPTVLPNKEWDVFGFDFEQTAPDPVPIKTYKYFEEDVTGKMIDPLASMVEALGALGPGQHLWFQLVINPIKEDWALNYGKPYVQELAGRNPKHGGVFSQFLYDVWDVLKSIIPGIFTAVGFEGGSEDKMEQPLEFRLTPVERDVLKAVEENIGKNVFRTKARAILIGRREVFDKGQFGSFMGGLKQFSEHNLNGFKPVDRTKTYANYFMAEDRKAYRQRQLVRRYRGRYPTGVNCMFSTEELASLFHMPDMSVAAPSIRFVDARHGGAPANLPIQR